MRERILLTLRTAAERGEIPAARWRELRDRTGDINISTIDAFCLSLLREFPLEADLDPGFSMADDMEVPRLVEESLDRSLRICRALAREDEAVALVFAQLSERRARRRPCRAAPAAHRRPSGTRSVSRAGQPGSDRRVGRCPWRRRTDDGSSRHVGRARSFPRDGSTGARVSAGLRGSCRRSTRAGVTPAFRSSRRQYTPRSPPRASTS